MTFASRALAELGEGEWLLESLATALLGSAEWLCGRLDEAERAMGSSVARWRDAGVHEMVAWWCQYLGQIQLAQGRLDRADETYRRALDDGTAVGQPSLLAAGSAYVGMAGVAYQRGDLDTAARDARRGPCALSPVRRSRRAGQRPGHAGLDPERPRRRRRRAGRDGGGRTRRRSVGDRTAQPGPGPAGPAAPGPRRPRRRRQVDGRTRLGPGGRAELCPRARLPRAGAGAARASADRPCPRPPRTAARVRGRPSRESAASSRSRRSGRWPMRPTANNREPSPPSPTHSRSPTPTATSGSSWTRVHPWPRCWARSWRASAREPSGVDDVPGDYLGRLVRAFEQDAAHSEPSSGATDGGRFRLGHPAERA